MTSIAWRTLFNGIMNVTRSTTSLDRAIFETEHYQTRTNSRQALGVTAGFHSSSRPWRRFEEAILLLDRLSSADDRSAYRKKGLSILDQAWDECK